MGEKATSFFSGVNSVAQSPKAPSSRDPKPLRAGSDTGCQGVRGIPFFGKTGTRWQDRHPMARLAPDGKTGTRPTSVGLGRCSKLAAEPVVSHSSIRASGKSPSPSGLLSRKMLAALSFAELDAQGALELASIARDQRSVGLIRATTEVSR